jgi:Zn-dependent protease/CBS domain-containing protein
MSGDIYLGKLAGISFRIHWSWFLAVFLVAWTLAVSFFPNTLPEYRDEGGVFWAMGLLAALGLFGSVLLHELGHAIVAKFFDVPVRGIRLFIFGGVAELASEPRRPMHEVLIALGGPIVTVLLIVLYNLGLSFILTWSPVAWNLSEGVLTLQGGTLLAAGGAAILFYLGMINTIVLLFNMVPAFPLDGGRVLRGIVWSVSGSFLTSTRIAGGIGIAFSWLMFVAGALMAFQGNLLGGIWMFFVGSFLQNAAQSSVAYAQLQQLMRGVRVADMMRRHPITIAARLTLREAVDQYFLQYPHKAYPVVEDARFLGILTLRALQEVPRDKWDMLEVGDVVSRDGQLPFVRPDEPVLKALQTMAESRESRLAVVENSELVGLLCSRDVMALIEIRAGLAPPRPETTPGENIPSRAEKPAASNSERAVRT